MSDLRQVLEKHINFDRGGTSFFANEYGGSMYLHICIIPFPEKSVVTTYTVRKDRYSKGEGTPITVRVPHPQVMDHVIALIENSK